MLTDLVRVLYQANGEAEMCQCKDGVVKAVGQNPSMAIDIGS